MAGEIEDVIIVSHFGLVNYGQRLQSHAIVYLLDQLGLTATVAAPYNHPIKQMAKDVAKSLVPSFLWNKKARYVSFKEFSRHYTPYRIIPASKLKDIAPRYRMAIVGSDQVWSPYYLKSKRYPESYFLEFMPKERKVALSPSFGVSDVPDDMKAFYVKGLLSFARLSVREDAGAAIIKRLTGLDATVLIDPTIAVSSEHWRDIASYTACPKNDYILLYYLGGVNEEARRRINEFATRNKCEIVDLANDKNGRQNAGPAEFVGLIDRAKYLVTDSFHGTALALLMHTPFCIVRRLDKYDRDMFSRMDTLVQKTGCSGRVFDPLCDEFPDSVINWELIESNIARERSLFMSYLNEEIKRCGVL